MIPGLLLGAPAALVSPAVQGKWPPSSLGSVSRLSSSYAFVRDLTGNRNLFEKAPDTQCPANYAASLAKLATAVVLLRWKWTTLATETTTVLSGETVGGTTANLQVGDTLTLLDLLHGLLMPSGNDAAEVIARYVGTSIFSANGQGATGRVRFVQAMNKLAAELGLVNTSFGSPHGIQLTPDGANNSVNITTARDIAKLAACAFNYPLLQSIARLDSYTMTITGANARTYNITAAYHMIDPSPDDGVLAGKGGTLSTASYSGAILWQTPGGHKLVCVQIGAGADGDRYLDMRAMMYDTLARFPDLDSPTLASASDPNFASVVLLSGAESGIVDESSYAHSLTAAGSPRSSVNPIIGAESYVFDGATAEISAASAGEFSFGSGDFTVEFWLRGNGTAPGSPVAFMSKYDATNNLKEWTVQWDNATGRIVLFVSTDGTAFIEAAHYDFAVNLGVTPTTFFNGAIRHILARRAGSEIAIYVNGLKGDTTYNIGTTSLFTGASNLMIGARQNGAGIQYPFPGAIDEVRITKGVARQTGTKFTPVARAYPRS